MISRSPLLCFIVPYRIPLNASLPLVFHIIIIFSLIFVLIILYFHSFLRLINYHYFVFYLFLSLTSMCYDLFLLLLHYCYVDALDCNSLLLLFIFPVDTITCHLECHRQWFKSELHSHVYS